MKNKSLRTLLARILFVLQLAQLLTPALHLNAASATQPDSTHKTNLGLPSRKVFKEVTECWEGLRPPAFIKNTAHVSAGSSFDATVRLVGGQQKTLSINRKNKAVAEAIQFLNNLASPGKALEKMNCSKRMMADMQMFYERGLFKSFNRTILSLGQALQIAQFYQGADSQKEAEERRDFITGLLRTPDAARAIGVRIRCFGKYENQFLRQTMTLRNESLEQKIKALEPSKIFGPLRNSPAFIRWHSRLTENPFFEITKNAYFLFAAYTVCNLFARSFIKNIPGMAKDYALSGRPLAAADSASSQSADQLSQAERDQIKRDIAQELTNKLRENIPGARYDILYHMGTSFLGSQKRQGLFVESAQHFAKNLPAAAGSLIVGPLQLIPAILMTLKKISGKKLEARQKSGTQSNKSWVRKLEELALKGCQKQFPVIPSLTAQTWEEGLDLLTTFPDLLAKNATDLIDSVGKAGKTQTLFWDGDPTTVKTSTALNDLFNFLNPIRSLLDHGEDNKKAVQAAMEKVARETTPATATAAERAIAGDHALQDPSKAAKAGALPGYTAYQNATIDPLKWVFGTRAMNIFYGNIPYIGWLRILTGNTSAYWKESKLFGSFVFNGLEAAANISGTAINKELGTFRGKDGAQYTLTLAPGAVEILTGINKAFQEKKLPMCALFCVSTTTADGTKKFLTQKELLEQGDLLKQLTAHIQTNADRIIKEKLAPLTLASQAASAQPNVEKLNGLKKQLEEKKKRLNKLKASTLKSQHRDEIKTIREENTTLEKQIVELEKTTSSDLVVLNEIAKNKQLTSRLLEGYIGYICFGLAAVYTLGNLKNQENVMITEELDSYMFSSLKPAVALSEMVRQITHILSKHTETIQLPQSLRTKLTMLVASATPNCKTFAKLAQNKMFLNAKKPLLFGDYGTLRHAYKIAALPDVKHWLSVCATFMAEVDSYLAIARLVAEHKEAPNYFYPITFLNQEAPRVELSGFWFPLIGAYKSIPNDLTIGDPAHILITGLNGGGKSFALKGLLFTILMSHAFGYGPVKKGSMTFFNKIITHLSTTDNAAEGESCWIAEAKSMGNAIHAMQAPHATGDRILYIGDELGSGTASAASIQAVASLMDIALEQPHVASIITTHLRPLTELEYLTNGKVHNYRVGGTVSDEGVIQRKFQLERGRANINIAALIFNQQLEQGEQKTLAPNAIPAPIGAAAA